MEELTLSGDAIAVLRSIALAGFEYNRSKQLACTAGWKVVDDELDLGYVRFDMRLAPGNGTGGFLIVQMSNSEAERPFALLRLFSFDDREIDRAPFDRAYRSFGQ